MTSFRVILRTKASFTPLCTSFLSGHAAPAEFKSAAEGRAEDSFLLEWTSLSYSTINSFRLEVAEEVSSTWK